MHLMGLPHHRSPLQFSSLSTSDPLLQNVSFDEGRGSKTSMVPKNSQKNTYIGEKTHQKCWKISNNMLTNLFLTFHSAGWPNERWSEVMVVVWVRDQLINMCQCHWSECICELESAVKSAVIMCSRKTHCTHNVMTWLVSSLSLISSCCSMYPPITTWTLPLIE